MFAVVFDPTKVKAAFQISPNAYSCSQGFFLAQKNGERKALESVIQSNPMRTDEPKKLINDNNAKQIREQNEGSYREGDTYDHGLF